MPQLTEKDKRTIRMASVLIAIYLALFYGLQGWNYLEAQKVELGNLELEKQQVRKAIVGERIKAARLEKLRSRFGVKPRQLNRDTLVAEATTAIQKAAQESGFGLMPGRETGARGSGREIAALQLEGQGALPAALGFLTSVQKQGYPLQIENLQFRSLGKPEQVKLSLRLVVIDPFFWGIQPATRSPPEPSSSGGKDTTGKTEAQTDDKPPAQAAESPPGTGPPAGSAEEATSSKASAKPAPTDGDDGTVRQGADAPASAVTPTRQSTPTSVQGETP